MRLYHPVSENGVPLIEALLMLTVRWPPMVLAFEVYGVEKQLEALQSRS